MKNAFDLARSISAADVARHAGIKLIQHGSRAWCCCPLHHEKTASCCFYPEGRWHCFGCGAGGDAVELYARLHQISRLKAAQELTHTTLPRRAWKQPQEWEPPFLGLPDEDGNTWDSLCDDRNAAMQAMELAKPDSPEFWAALAQKSRAEIILDGLLEQAAERM